MNIVLEESDSMYHYGHFRSRYFMGILPEFCLNIYSKIKFTTSRHIKYNICKSSGNK
jgi:hypothetical protein